jgi:hypothetical protein
MGGRQYIVGFLMIRRAASADAARLAPRTFAQMVDVAAPPEILYKPSIITR